MMKIILVILGIFLFLSGCSIHSGAEDRIGQISNRSVLLNQEQRRLADQIISVFENNSPVIQYAYIEYLDDGRGYTAGRAGFTTATGDMLDVVSRYTTLDGSNPFALYLPRLTYLAAHESASIAGLEGFENAWRESALDTSFQRIQDKVVEDDYYLPAVAHAKQIGAHYPLTLLNFYDAIIQHGDGEDADGLPALITRTNNHVGGTPKTGVNELRWLQAFMTLRKADLLAPHNRATQQEWAESVNRVATLQKLYDNHNYQLTAPIVIHPWGKTFVLPLEE